MEELIKNYIQTKLTKEDIEKVAKKQNVVVTKEEVEIIFFYLKNHWQEFYKGKPEKLWKELEIKLSNSTYQELVNLYKKYKNKI